MKGQNKMQKDMMDAKIQPVLTLKIKGKTYTKYNPKYIKYLKNNNPGISDEEIQDRIELAIAQLFFARKTKINFVDFYDIILGLKPIKTKEEKENFEACYFAMCFLLPEDKFLKKIEMLGGIKKGKPTEGLIFDLADFFNVPRIFASIRLRELLSQKEQEELEGKKLTKTI